MPNSAALTDTPCAAHIHRTTESTNSSDSDGSAGGATAHGFAGIAAAFEAATTATKTAGFNVTTGDVLAEPLVRAILRFLVVFDALGSVVIGRLVAADFKNKTENIRRALTRENVETVGAVVSAERKRPPSWLEANATESLLWAKRVLAFVDNLVMHLLDGSELQHSATEAYRSTLGLKHNAVTRAVFENALSLLPDRHTFVTNLYNVHEPTKEQLNETVISMKAFRTACAPHIDAFQTVFPEE